MIDLINSNTYKWIESYLANPKATAIIETNNDTESGIEVAEHLYKNLVDTGSVPLYSLEINEKKSLGIDDVKVLKDYFSLKADITEKYTRFAIIKNAELLTNEAQNSLLKVIEELPERTILVLIVNDSSKILDTIASRCFTIKLLPVEYSKAKDLSARKGVNEELFKRAYLLSEGNSSAFLKYLNSGSEDIDNTLKYSKDFVSSSIFVRQGILTRYSKEDYTPLQLIKSVQLISKSTMRSAKTIDSKLRWKEILEKSILAETQINSNVNSKLVLLNLSVSI